jgi:nucleotide-binding universal stress UspA family protein
VPIRTILVGVDFSPASEVAGRQAIAVARRTGGRVVLAHAAALPEEPEGLPPSMASTAQAYLGILRKRVAEDRVLLDELAAQLGGQGAELSSMLVDGFADEALVTAAHDLSADLLVAGAHGHRGLGRVLLGGVVERIARSASCPVLVSRAAPSSTDGGFHRILVATDFSDAADRGLDLALEIAAEGAAIELVHFWQLPIVPRTHAKDEVDATMEEVRGGMEEHGRARGAERLAARDTSRHQVRYALREGDTRDGIVDLARIAACDLVVIGSHGRRGLRRFVLGSVAEHTVRHAPCSVLVAR